eukprot:2121919-Pleurochrysis_carterae.AAC.2
MAFTGSLFPIPSVPSRQCLPESSFSRLPSFSRTAFLQQTCFPSPSVHWHFQYWHCNASQPLYLLYKNM